MVCACTHCVCVLQQQSLDFTPLGVVLGKGGLPSGGQSCALTLPVASLPLCRLPLSAARADGGVILSLLLWWGMWERRPCVSSLLSL